MHQLFLMHPLSSTQYHRRALTQVRNSLLCKELITLTLIWLALLSQLAGSLNRRFRTVLLQVIIRHDLTTYEFVLKVGAVQIRQLKSLESSTPAWNSLDDTGCLRSLRALPDRPGPNLIRPTRKVPNQLQAAVPSLRNLWQRARRANLLLLLFLLCCLEWCQSFLHSDREGDERIARVVRIYPGLYLGQPFVLFADVISFREVDEVRDGFGGEELETVYHVYLIKKEKSQ
jgi:hypothetical protein